MLNHLYLVPLALLAASTTVLSSPLRSRTEYAVKDTHNVPSKWYEVGPAPAHALLHLHIGLKQSQFDELERHLYEGMSAWSPASPLRAGRFFMAGSIADIWVWDNQSQRLPILDMGST